MACAAHWSTWVGPATSPEWYPQPLAWGPGTRSFELTPAVTGRIASFYFAVRLATAGATCTVRAYLRQGAATIYGPPRDIALASTALGIDGLDVLVRAGGAPFELGLEVMACPQGPIRVEVRGTNIIGNVYFWGAVSSVGPIVPPRNMTWTPQL